MTQKQLPARLDRVKVYNLNEKGTWDDKGIGSVRIEESLGLVGQQQRTPATGAPGRSIVVLGEVSGRPIMVAHINSTNNYQRQGDGTIITWNDPDFRTDVALSFQHGEGCEQVVKRSGTAMSLASTCCMAQTRPEKFHGYAPNTPTWLEAKPPRELADAPRSDAGWVD